MPERFSNAGRRWRLAWRPISIPAFCVVVLYSGAVMLRRIDASRDLLRSGTEEATWLGALERRAYPFRSVNSYGLFARMTTHRPEIVIEGSPDGSEWRAYELTWKPGALDREPRQVAPHMPRLDWQFWFAAMGPWQRASWVQALLARLLEGEPSVLALFADNPFPDGPPKYVRASVHDYRFTTPAERERTGDVWKREAPRLWCPVRSLR